MKKYNNKMPCFHVRSAYGHGKNVHSIISTQTKRVKWLKSTWSAVKKTKTKTMTFLFKRFEYLRHPIC